MNLAQSNGQAIQVGGISSATTQKVTTGNQSTAFAKDSLIRVVANGDCYILAGDNPTADANSIPLFENQVECFYICKDHKISVLGATLTITTLG